MSQQSQLPLRRAVAILEGAFPFRAVLSFEPLLDFWRQVAEAGTSPVREHLARTILEKVEGVEALRGDVEDLSALEEHRFLVEMMLMGVLPLALGDRVFAGAVVPFKMTPVFMTPAAAERRLFDPTAFEERIDMPVELLMAGKAILAYNVALSWLYGVEADIHYPMVLTLEDEDSGLQRHLQVGLDPRFVRVEATGPLPELSEEDIASMISDPSNLELWMEKLPPTSFEFRGLTLVAATDVTHQESLSRLKNDLLHSEALTSPAHLDRVRGRLRNFLGRPELEFGLIAIERGQDVDDIVGAHPVGRSILMDKNTVPACSRKEESCYARAFESSDPVIVHDLDSEARTSFEQHLLAQGFRSLVIYPLRLDGRMLGFLEVATPRRKGLNALDSLKLYEVVDLFATAMKRTLEEQEDRIQALIKEQYTAIHPVVEWRFRDAAHSYLEQQASGKVPQREPIVFKDLHPLYGLTDLRGSSEQRNTAIQSDLIYQLDLAAGVIGAATRARRLPILDELAYRIRALNEAIQDGLTADDESTVLEFLHDGVESLFDRVAGYGGEVRSRVDEYREALDPELGILYRRRKEFDDSVALINDTVALTLEEEEIHAQAMFPHYFEMFKTDGVDYSIYVGDSLLEHGGFDRLYLRNLRLWQLMLMCRIEWKLRDVRPQMMIPLDATHLVLVQNTPLSIRFRSDEKQFDVDGAYNIRYEIVKKRIDKARIRNSQERLTQPGKLAIAYSHEKEAEEYLGYLDYLEAAGYTMPGVEPLDLEDFQGVYGLKALRVAIADEPVDRRHREEGVRPEVSGLAGKGSPGLT
jgi:GAF domain-containing protein